MIHSVEIAFLFMSFKPLRLEREQADITGLRTTDLWHEFQIRKYVFKASGTRFSGCEVALLAIAMSLRVASQILNKAKDFFESLKYYLRM